MESFYEFVERKERQRRRVLLVGKVWQFVVFVLVLCAVAYAVGAGCAAGAGCSEGGAQFPRVPADPGSRKDTR